eukprot:jgi/Pico_ML_1/50796/g1940.t1
MTDRAGLPEGTNWTYSEFLEAVDSGKVERVRFSKDASQLQLTAVDGRRALVTLPNDPELVDLLAKNGVDISVSEGESQGNYVALIGNLLFPSIAFGGLFFLFRCAQGGGGPMGGGGGPMEFGKSKSTFQEVPETGVLFDDMAGVDGAKIKLQEIVDFLKSPDKYKRLGAKIPKGCLLLGLPGMKKTLLAKAVAGETGVPFFSCAASEFVELFVCVGASRVRDLLEKAKAKAPCIVFIDEIDAVGRHRGADLQNLMNEAATLAAGREFKEISKEEIADALERIIAGPEKKNSVMSDKKKKQVAYHEAGRGLTFFAPSEERPESGLYSRSYLENQMAVALGGRIAEELILGEDDITTGASNDLMQVTRTARMMITQMGFSKTLGQISYGGGGPNFLGQELGSSSDYSLSTADKIDEEVKDLVKRAYRRAEDLVLSNIKVMHKTAEILLEKETIDGEEFQGVVAEYKASMYLEEDAPEVTIPYSG